MLAATLDTAERRFRLRHAGVSLPPVAAVIAAYEEEACIGGVLAELPGIACGLQVRAIVVDDGSRDDTAAVARAHGALVARLDDNCGQGAAFQVGYRLARELGAEYIVTLDADGQWPPAALAQVLHPVVAGDADLVLGSRVLGSAEPQPPLRRAGVLVFSTLVRVLTGARVTDTSSGLRAMRAEVTAAVPLQEPQYQASELLVGALVRGYRVGERPVAMRRRAAGESKKGNDALYGFRYARVVVRTWWRARRR